MPGRGARGAAQPPVMGAPAIYVLAAFSVLVLGLNWPFMSIGVQSIPPLWLATVRLLGAGLLMGLALAVTRQLRLPPRADIPIVLSVGIVRLALVWGLLFSALAFVPPGRSSVLQYTSSLWTALLARYFLGEPLRPLRLAGVISGVAGVVVMLEPWALGLEGPGTALGYAMLIASAIAVGAGTVHVRGHHWEAGPLDLMPWQLTLAGALTGVAALALEGPLSLAWSLTDAAIVVYQVVYASAFGFWGVVTMGRSLLATTTNLLLMAVPVVGVVSSVVLVGERLSLTLVVGMALVLVGVAAGTRPDGSGSSVR
jgi:drug/metabolite transporter (DMT)-like permease